MSTLPHVPRVPIPPEQRQHLAAWLREWNAAEILHETPAPPGDLSLPADDPTDKTAGPVVRGEIRLLSRRALPAAERPVYVAVLSDWEDDLKLVAPYSSFLAPALPGELLTGRTDHPLRVLCLWNTRSVPARALIRSWVVDELSDREREDAWTVFRHILTGRPLPADLAARVGLPTTRPDDPRVRYQRGEIALLAPLTQAALAQAATPPSPAALVDLAGWWEAIDRPDLALAAQRGAVFEPTAAQIYLCWTGEEHAPRVQVHVQIVLELDQQHFSLLLLDADGEPNPSLDGGEVLDAAGRVLTALTGSRARFPAGAVRGGFQIRSAQGEPVVGWRPLSVED